MDNEKKSIEPAESPADRIAELEEILESTPAPLPRRNNRLFTIVFILIFLIGGSMAVYPFVSDLILESKQADAVDAYKATISAMSAEEKQQEFEKAQQYNSDKSSSDYSSALSTGDIMCVVEIPSLDVNLPVYHGTSAKVLDFALGHVETTSLPVGGEGTHCVITGHTGLTRVRILDNLDKMVEGDIIYIHVLGKVLEYKADNISIIEPHDTSGLRAVDGEDYLTLVTCYPYGVNSHRLCVRGTRVGTYDEESFKSTQTSADTVTTQNAYETEQNIPSRYENVAHRGEANYIFIALVAIFAVALIVIIIIACRPKKNKK